MSYRRISSTPGAPVGVTSTRDVDDPWTGAACRGVDPELFFPDSRGNGEPLRVFEAKTVCAGCDVRRECLEGALERREPWGVWGGELLIAGIIIRARPRQTRSQEDAA